MVDWHDTQAFFKEHWKPIVIVTVIVIVVVVAVSLTLVFVLRRKPVPSASVPPFNGPHDINGDPAQNANTFSYPQIIANPLPGSSYFGYNMYVHEAGYIATTIQRPGTNQAPSMLFYYTNMNGEIQGPQEIVLDMLPTNYTVYNGAFAPIFNTSGEVYYLFVSVGLVSSDGNPYPIYVLLFSLDTSVTSNVWQLSDVNTTYTYDLTSNGKTYKVMKLPNASFTWNSSGLNPWYGTFGLKIQVVLDDNESIVKQSLYISGSEFDPNLPGGNLYWYVLENNTTSPNITLISVIQDAKLLMMKNQGNCPNGCPACTGTCTTFDPISQEACTNGFASDFYVTSGNGAKNILVVANSTPQDNCVLTGSDQPCAPKGYVQGYILNAHGGVQSWVQPQAGDNTFLYRYIGTNADPAIHDSSLFGGFANSVAVIDGHLLIGQGLPTTSPPDKSGGNATFLVFDWVPYPYNSGSGFLNPIGKLDPTSNSPSAFPLSSMYPTAILRYNQGPQLINDGSNQLLVTSWYQPGPADVISIQSPSGTSDTFASFSFVQSLGAGYSSQALSSPDVAFLGFAQGCATWISRTGASVRLAFNDPCRQNNTGRLIILTRKRQS